MSGRLWVVATPIGNISDFSARAIEVLRDVDLILAEDTRHSRRLLDYYQITTPMQAWHLFNERQKLDGMLQKLQRGEELALISDAGTPLISDPGSLLVDACHRNQIPVSAVPGACAAIAALSVSGINAERFYFEGFLPAKSGERQKRLCDLATMPCTVICYEAPHRLLASLADMAECLGKERVVAVAKELTKLHEQVLRAELGDQLAYWSERAIKGEWVIVIEPAAVRAVRPWSQFSPSMRVENGMPGSDFGGGQPQLLTVQQQRLLRELRAKLPTKQAVKLVADLTGLRANELYKAYCVDSANSAENGEGGCQ